MKRLIISSKDIEVLRGLMRKAGCVYEGIRGWFHNSRPIGIYFENGEWFTVLGD